MVQLFKCTSDAFLNLYQLSMCSIWPEFNVYEMCTCTDAEADGNGSNAGGVFANLCWLHSHPPHSPFYHMLTDLKWRMYLASRIVSV